MKVVVVVVAALLLGALALGYRSTQTELRCFLHCHDQPPVETTRRGWPFAYWSRTVEPGDPPRLVDASLDPVALGFDLLVLGLLLSGLALAKMGSDPFSRATVRKTGSDPFSQDPFSHATVRGVRRNGV